MPREHVKPTGVEVHFADHEIIVSKTDPRGVITYANDIFQRVSGYSEAELLGQPHNLIRHPEMPRCVFGLLWDTLRSGREIFAYVVNLARDGRHYWVFAHVTPSFDADGRIVGFHSNRRVPYPDALPKVRELYATLLAEEAKWADPRKAIEASTRLLVDLLGKNGVSYSQFVFSLSESTRLGAVA
jgi:PAS domain S-box-containing protein